MTDTLKPPLFLKKLAALVVIQIIQHVIAKLKEEIAQEMDKFRSTHNQKKRVEPHTSARPLNLQNSQIYDFFLYILQTKFQIQILTPFPQIH